MTEPFRMCVSCRKRDAQKNLLRISCDKNTIVLNSKVKDSRSIYVCKEKKCIEILKKSNAIKRLLGVDVDDSVYMDLLNKF